MEFRESFNLIIDGQSDKIEFMKSFGLSCDSAGWSHITIENEETLQLLECMKRKVSTFGGTLRCQNYRKVVLEKNATWYYIKPQAELPLDDLKWDDTDSLELVGTSIIKGYKIQRNCNLFELPWYYGVSHNFVNACKELQLTGIEFVWITDQGKFDAPPYFYIVPQNRFMYCTESKGETFDKPKCEEDETNYKNFIDICKTVDSDGSHMEIIASLVDEFIEVRLPILIDKKTEPPTDFAFIGQEVLIRKSAAKDLIKKGLLSWSELEAAVYFDESKHQNIISKCETIEYLPKEIIEVHKRAYVKWSKKRRPKYVPSIKDSLKLLRLAKAKSPQNYNKPLKKVLIEEMENQGLKELVAYYKISNGGLLNSEFMYFEFKEILSATKKVTYEELIQNNVLECQQIDSNFHVIGKTFNGDLVLLDASGQVFLYNHEEPLSVKKWESIHSFFYDQIEIYYN